jgi:ribosomal protein S1
MITVSSILHVWTVSYCIRHIVTFMSSIGLLMYVKEKQRLKKRSSYVKRPIPLRQRTILLSDLQPGKIMNGTVISMTSFGAYIDIGTQVDGLLHISQLSHTDFIEHPKQLLSIGQNINVTIRSYSMEKKKLHLTLLPFDLVQDDIRYNDENCNEKNDSQDEHGVLPYEISSPYEVKGTSKIPLYDIQIDDELWGIIKRVTNYGAYVDVGATVLGFLHFMDHPLFDYGQQPKDFMYVNDRIRCWVMKNDYELNRIQLTCIRPNHLPGPKRG